MPDSLEPNLRPVSPIWKRLILLLVLLLAVLLAGILSPKRGPTATQLLITDAKADNDYLRHLMRHIALAEERVWVAVFVMRRSTSGSGPVTALGEALQSAQQRGVDVRVVLDQGKRWGSDEIDPKHQAPQAWLQSLGIPVLIDELDRTSHSKIVLIDNVHSFVGSHNWTTSALRYNRETSIYCHDAKLANDLAAEFQALPGWSALAVTGPKPSQ